MRAISFGAPGSIEEKIQAEGRAGRAVGGGRMPVYSVMMTNGTDFSTRRDFSLDIQRLSKTSDKCLHEVQLRAVGDEAPGGRDYKCCRNCRHEGLRVGALEETWRPPGWYPEPTVSTASSTVVSPRSKERSNLLEKKLRELVTLKTKPVVETDTDDLSVFYTPIPEGFLMDMVAAYSEGEDMDSYPYAGPEMKCLFMTAQEFVLASGL